MASIHRALANSASKPSDEFTGRIESPESVGIRPRVSGYIQEVRFEERRELAQDRLAQSHTKVATSLVAVYKSLAGGWPERLPELTENKRRAR